MPRYEAADGASLHYDEMGMQPGQLGQPPLIVLAGGAARHPSYLGDLAGLSEQHALVVPHLRGVGESPRPATRTRGSYWSQTEDIERLRVHLGLEALTLVAHSAGTRLAMAYAAQHPQRVRRLVLITPPALHLVHVESDIAALADRRSNDPTFGEAFTAQDGGPPTDTDDSFNKWMQRTAPVSYARWGEAERSHSQLGRWNLPAAQAYFSVEPPIGFAAMLAGVSCPVLVIAGAEDCLTGLIPVLALSELFSAGEAAVIDGAGHYPWVEEPRQFRVAVDSFLAAEADAGAEAR